MTYLVSVVVPDGGSRADERGLATGEFLTVREAAAWVSRNSETWRGALEEHETHFEAWVQDGEGEIALHVRHSKTFGDKGETSTRAEMRAMAKAMKKGGGF